MIEHSTIFRYKYMYEGYQVMNVIKRSGEEVTFDVTKIINAIAKANKATLNSPMSDEVIEEISNNVVNKCKTMKRSANVEEIQDMVEKEIMAHGFYTVAKNYISL